MADVQEIKQLLDPITESEFEADDLLQYTESQLLYIQDNNNGSYSSGQINFFCTALRNQWVNWRNVSLAIPLTITSSGTAMNAATLLSLKQSITDLIQGISVTTSEGVQIVNEQSNQTVIINRLRQLISTDIDWLTQEGASLMFDLDRLVLPTATVGITSPVATVAGNTGYATKIGYLKQSVNSGDTTTWSLVVNIPLRYLHSLWDNMDFPCFNTDFNITFFTNGFAGSNAPVFYPLVVDAINPGVVPVIAITPNQSPPGTENYSIGSCRLYYKQVKFGPEVLARIQNKMLSPQGLHRRVYFTLTDLYTPLASEIATTSATNRLISSNTVYPTRIWFLAQANAAGPTTAASKPGTLADYTVGYTQLNAKINNRLVYVNNLFSTQEQYEVLKEQMPGYGESSTISGLLPYDRFLSTYRLMCIDLKRIQGQESNPWQAVSIEVDACPATVGGAAVAADLYYIVEKMWVADFYFTAGKTEIKMGNIQH